MTDARSRTRRAAVAGAVVAATLLVIAAAWPVAPLWWYDRQLDEAVKVVALDLRDFGEERAWERLRVELAQRGVAHRVPASACRISNVAVRCEWSVVLLVPWLERRVPLRFASAAEIGDGGLLR